jgi:hypothetical protein
MNCRRAQAEFSRTRDERGALLSEVDCHFSTCDECASFRETTVALERRYRSQVRSGIDRLRRLEPPAFRVRKSLRKRLWIPLAASALVCGWGLASGKPAAPAVSRPGSVAILMSATPTPSRSLLFEDCGLLERLGPELSFLNVGEPLLPVRLDQDFHGIRLADPETALPRNLRF